MFDLLSSIPLLWVAGGTALVFIGYWLQRYSRQRQDRQATVDAWWARLETIEAESPDTRRVCPRYGNEDHAYVFFVDPEDTTQWRVEHLVCNATGQTWLANSINVIDRDDSYIVIRAWICLRKPIDGRKVTQYTPDGLFR